MRFLNHCILFLFAFYTVSHFLHFWGELGLEIQTEKIICLSGDGAAAGLLDGLSFFLWGNTSYSSVLFYTPFLGYIW